MSKHSLSFKLICGILIMLPLISTISQGSSTIPMSFDANWTWEINVGDMYYYKLQTYRYDHSEWGWQTTYFAMKVNQSWEYDTPQFSAIQLVNMKLNSTGAWVTSTLPFFWAGDYVAEIYFDSASFYAHSEDVASFTAIPIIVPLNTGALDLATIINHLQTNYFYNFSVFNSVDYYYDTWNSDSDSISVSDTLYTDRYYDIDFNANGIATYMSGRHDNYRQIMTLVNQTEARNLALPPKLYYKQILNNITTNAFYRFSGYTQNTQYNEAESILKTNASVSHYLMDDEYWTQLTYDTNREIGDYSNFRGDLSHYTYLENRSAYFWREVNLLYYANVTNGTTLRDTYNSSFYAQGFTTIELGINYVRFIKPYSPYFAYIEADNNTGFLTRYLRCYQGEDFPYTIDSFIYYGDFNETSELLNVTFGLRIGDSLIYKFLRQPVGYNRQYFRYRIVDEYIQSFTSELGYSIHPFKVLVAQYEYWWIEEARWLAYPNWEGRLYVDIGAANRNASLFPDTNVKWVHPIDPVSTHAKIIPNLPSFFMTTGVVNDSHFDFIYYGNAIKYTLNNQTGLLTYMNFNYTASNELRINYEVMLITEADLPNNYLPSANFSVAIEGLTVSLNSTSISLNTITNYSWNFGDNATARGFTVNHTYAMAGQYTITLTITDSNGDVSSFSLVITVSTEPISPYVWIIAIVGAAGAGVLIWVLIRNRRIAAGSV